MEREELTGLAPGARPLLGMTPEELRAVAAEAGLPPYAAGQMERWLHARGAVSVDEMTDIPLSARRALAQSYSVGRAAPTDRQVSADGTVKYLFPAAGGRLVESVFIPEEGRATLCVSSQAGCRMGCRFCMTGRQGYGGSLSTADILNQVYSLPERGRLTNIVFMGQGEPLDNLEAVLRATRALCSPRGMAWSPKRVTVSTVGVRGGLERFLLESECHLAVSLHSPFPEERARMMPAERAYGMEEALALLRRHDWSHQRRLSFEYIVFGGLNDTPAHAARLAALLRGLECRVNLIRFHAIPDTPFRGAGEEKVQWMRDYLAGRGVRTTIRASRGEDISAACGLLHAKAAGAEKEGRTRL